MDALSSALYFAPETLNDRFDLIYADGGTILLTWKGSGRAVGRLTPAAIHTLRSAITSNRVLNDLYQRLDHYYQRNGGAAYPVSGSNSAAAAGMAMIFIA